jgi:hypothetical protein
MQNDNVDLAQYPWSTWAGAKPADDTNNADERPDPGAFRPGLIPVPSDSEEDADPNDFAYGVRVVTSPSPQPINDGTPIPTEQPAAPVHTVFTANNGRDIGRPVSPGLRPGNGCIHIRKPQNPSPLSTGNSHRNERSGEEDQQSEESREPLVDLPIQGSEGYVTSFEALDTYTKLERRTAFTATYAGLDLPDQLRQRIARVWRLLHDVVVVTTVANLARDVYNHHCADLIDTFSNLSPLVWRTPVQPGGNLDQLAIDLIRRMLSADIERYLVPAIQSLQKRESRIQLPPHANPRDFIFRKHEEVNDSIIPDRRHSDQFIKDTTKDTDDIRALTSKISDLLDRIQGNAEWITDGQRDGYPGKFFTHEETEIMNTAISDLDLHHYVTPLQPPLKKAKTKRLSFPDYTCPTTRSMTNASRHNRRQRCIHCKGNHESADHHTATTIPPVHRLPPRPTQRTQDLTPGPSTTSYPSQSTTNARRRRAARYAKKKKEREEFLARKARHSPNQCNRCINGRQCNYADFDSDDEDHHLGYGDLDDAGIHNLDTRF